MRLARWTLWTVLLVVAASAAVLAHGEGDSAGDNGEWSVEGEIVDLACYLTHQATGSEHAACARRCVQGGQPMGLLTEDGTVYLLLANHSDGSAFEQAKEHAGARVIVSGKTASAAGIHGLEVHSVRVP